MRKEILLAIIIGLMVGLVLTYGFYLARNALRRVPSNDPQTQTVMLNEADETAGNLSIVSPLDESVQTNRTLTIAGATVPNSFVVIFVNDAENITTADESGNFSIEATLEMGSNLITFHAIDSDGQQTVVERTVIVIAPETNDTATGSAEQN